MAIENLAERLAGDLHAFGTTPAPALFASRAGKSKITMNDPEDAERHPVEIDGHEALDDSKYRLRCSGLSEVVCDPWKFDTFVEVTAKKVEKIEYESEKLNVGNHSVRLRIWRIITHSTIEHHWTYKYKVCCCRWLWGAFRFPYDCRSFYVKTDEGDKVVPELKERHPLCQHE